MKKIIFICITMTCWYTTIFAQGIIIAGDKIKPILKTIIHKENSGFLYKYTISNDTGAQQEIYRFLLIPSSAIAVNNLNAPEKWYIGVHNEDLFIINCVASDKNIKPGNSLGIFSFYSFSIPGVIIFYAEGEHPLPSFPEGMADDSIPGYDDLTPYGPGVVGRTIGPTVPPINFVATIWCDTLLSYTRQSVALCWLKTTRDDDCDDDEQPNDGVAKNIEKRIEKAKKELMKGDSVKARKELEKLVKKVERIYKKSEELEKKKREREMTMTSEAYALLKYNTEYLIERLPENKRGK